jgi:tetratricopeptide (TPR) repeat protein
LKNFQLKAYMLLYGLKKCKLKTNKKMKKLVLTLAAAIIAIQFSFANNPAYMQAMGKQLQALGQAQNAEELKEVANGFVRIANLNDKEWLPNYYAALALTRAGFTSAAGIKEKDALFQEARTYIDKALKIAPNHSELLAIKGFAYMGELNVDPQLRGQHLSAEVMDNLGLALRYNAENPRAMILMAQMQLGMAKFFGEGPEKACGMAKRSLQLFEQEKNREKNNPFEPSWGVEMAEGLLQQCK